MDYIIAFLLKFINNCLSTAKTITVSKGNYLLGAVFNAVSELFYLLVMVKVIKSNDLTSMIVVCLAVFFGTYLTGVTFKKQKKETLYVFDVTSDSLENGILFADSIRNLNIPIKTYKTFDSNMKKCLSCKIYCNTKEDSKIVESLMFPAFKYNQTIPVE